MSNLTDGKIYYDETILKDIVLALLDDEQMLRRYIKQLEELNLGVLPLYTILVDIEVIKNYLERQLRLAVEDWNKFPKWKKRFYEEVVNHD